VKYDAQTGVMMIHGFVVMARKNGPLPVMGNNPVLFRNGTSLAGEKQISPAPGQEIELIPHVEKVSEGLYDPFRQGCVMQRVSAGSEQLIDLAGRIPVGPIWSARVAPQDSRK